MNLIRLKSLSIAVSLQRGFLSNVQSGDYLIILTGVCHSKNIFKFQMLITGTNSRLFASSANGRKNGKTNGTVNNNNSKSKKLAKNASAKIVQSNFINEQQKQQSTNIITNKTNKPSSKLEKDTQNEKRMDDKHHEKIVKIPM